MTNKLVSRFIIGTFVTLYTLVSVISTIHVIDFFELSNPYWLAVTLAIGFELGAAASLASLVILKKMNKTLVWALFITITLMQMQGNMYYAFVNLEDFQSWSELFNLIEEEPLYQKRVLSFVSGAILPLVALGFIKSLVDYIKPEGEEELVSDDVAGFDDAAREGEGSGYFEDEHEEYFGDGLIADIETLHREEFSTPTEDQLRQAEEDLDAYREDVLGNVEDGWDEDHALDQVLNDMAVEIEELTDSEEAADWDNTLLDGLEEEHEFDVEQFRSSQALAEDADDELALERALEARAEEEKDNYLKNNDNA